MQSDGDQSARCPACFQSNDIKALVTTHGLIGRKRLTGQCRSALDDRNAASGILPGAGAGAGAGGWLPVPRSLETIDPTSVPR